MIWLAFSEIRIIHASKWFPSARGKLGNPTMRHSPAKKKTNSRDRKESARKRRGAQAKERANENGVSRRFAFCLYAHLGYSTFGNERCRVDAEPLIPFDSSNCLGCTTISSIRIPGVCLCVCICVCLCSVFVLFVSVFFCFGILFLF